MKLGRNDPCSCGSGRKYKNCCMGKAGFRPADTLSVRFNQLVDLFNAGHHTESENGARTLLKQYPNSGFAWKLLGISLKMQGKEALFALQKATELLPNDADAFSNLGVALKDSGQFNDALASFRRALEIKPDFTEAYSNLGAVLNDIGQFKEAAANCRHALKINPNYGRAHYNLGNALKGLGQLDSAVESYHLALEINPNFIEVYNNLGATLQELGQLEEAAKNYRRALEIAPNFIEAHSNLLFVLNYIEGHEPSYFFEQARQYGLAVSGKVSARFYAWICPEYPERLRVGIVSGDLHNHPVGHFLESLLAQLDYTRIELIAYPTDMQSDDLTARIKPCFTAWKSLFKLNDEDAARLIQSDGVHVLLDLSGHTGKNRLPVFAWKPAPIQASWLGYFATTGVAEMDYLLADKTSVPESRSSDFSEAVWYLPDTRLCFTEPKVNVSITPLPMLRNGYLTLGSFQNLAKVGNDVLKMWDEILAELPNARLRLQCKQLGDSAVAMQFVERLRQHGINPNRVTLHGTVSREAYLAAYGEVDMVLDTFPFPGGTTTCEALWMGVPTLTLAGDTLLTRQGASLLTAAGLEEWVATSKEDYKAKAVALSSDIPKLAALRAGLRNQVLASPLFDAPRFARNFEAALWGMWQKRTQSKLQ